MQQQTPGLQCLGPPALDWIQTRRQLTQKPDQQQHFRHCHHQLLLLLLLLVWFPWLRAWVLEGLCPLRVLGFDCWG
jgi:hypothetical protein